MTVPLQDILRTIKRPIRYAIVVGGEIAELASKTETCKQFDDPALFMKEPADYTLRADLLVFLSTPQTIPARQLMKQIKEQVHEAGAIYLAQPYPELEQLLVTEQFNKTALPHLFLKTVGLTPKEYAQGYLDRWGDADFMKNWKMSGEQILVHMPKGMTKETVRILDVGCLNGYIMEALRRNGAKQVAGCDISYQIAINQQVDPYHLAAITIGDFIDNPYPDKISDMTICMEVLEHIPPQNTDPFIKELSRVTSDNGVLLISTSDDWDADPTHLNCRSRREWFYILAQHNLVPAKRRQLIYGGFNSFIVKKASSSLQAWFFRAGYGLLYKIERWGERSYRQHVAQQFLPWLRTAPVKSYARFGEDLQIRDLFTRLGKPKPSYFVAATQYQKTPAPYRTFQLFGSRGLFVHPNQQSQSRFPYQQSRDKHVVGDLRDKGDLTIGSILAEKWKGHFPEILFLGMGKKNLKLLQSIDFDRFGPTVICIAMGADDEAIATFAADKKYTLIGKTLDHQIFLAQEAARKIMHA